MMNQENMPGISQDEVKRIAALARLGLSDEEVQAATNDLSSILGHFSTIQAVDTKGVPTADDASGLRNVMREDTAVKEHLCSTESLLAAAPEIQNSQVKVHAVF